MLNYDDVLASLGEFGVYQKRLCFYMLILSMPFGAHLTSSVFNNVAPNFRCAVPGLINDTYAIQDAHHESLVKAFIPMDEDGEHYSQCETYEMGENFGLGFGFQSPDRNSTTVQCHRWVYDENGVSSQVVDFNLVCDRAMYKAHGNLMLLLGLLVGSLVGGTLSDMIGRKTTLLASMVLQAIFACAMAFVLSIHFVLALRFLTACTGSIYFMALFVLLAETVGVSRRSIATMASMVGFTAGMFVVNLVQFVFTDWRTAQLVQSTPFLACGAFWWLIQESPRWLITKNRQKEVTAVIAYIAKVNKVSLPKEMELMTDAAVMKSPDTMHDGKDDDDVTPISNSNQPKLWHICSRPRIFIRFAILCFSWITVNLVYYGLVLGVGDIIQGDIYVNFALQSAMEIVSHTTLVAILERTGRKTIYCSTMILSGLATLGIGVLVLVDTHIQWLSIALFCLGKLGISIGFSVVYIITTELLPTKIRNSGLGVCSCVARISGIVSPYIVSASLLIPGPFGKAFPVLIFGMFSLTSGLSAMFLPETRNAELPENFDYHQNAPTTKTKA